ncbi:MAG: hypothetical protein WAW12_13415 [Pseudomonas sp.]
MRDIFLALVSLAILSNPSRASEMNSSHKQVVNAYLMKIASGLNKNTPTRVDKAMVLMNVTVEGITLMHRYLVDMTVLRDTSIELFGVAPTSEEFNMGLKASTLKFDCSDPDDNPIFLAGAKIGRNYYDAKQNLLFSVINEKDECDTPQKQ